MSESLLDAIKDQMKQQKYQIVMDTQKRLKSLELNDEQVYQYLNWAYQNALSETGELDDKQYFQNLNQLPLIDESPKVIKTLSIEEALNILNDLLVQQQSSLQDVRIDYWYATMILDDGYKAQVRIMGKVRPIELADVLAMREGIGEEVEVEVVLETDGSPIILNDFQSQEPLDELVEEQDTLRFYFKQEQVKIDLVFSKKQTQKFHAIESVV